MNSGSYTYPYPRPMVTVDALLIAPVAVDLRVLLIRRRNDPWKGMWAIPGGFVEMDEPLETAAARELTEETGVTGVPLTQFGTFGNVGRDPRGRVITAAYLSIVDADSISPRAGDDAADVAWHSIGALPRLASDHDLIIKSALRFLRTLSKAGEIEDLLPTGIDVGDFGKPAPGA